MNEHISSLQNTKIKNIVKLQKPNERRDQGLFVIEGEREIQIALSAQFKLHSYYYCSDLGAKTPKLPAEVECYSISKEVYQKIAYRENSDGCLALAKPINLKLEQIRLSTKPFIIVLEAVEKPGNLGAILRTADAAQVDAIIICNPQTDIYNPNVVRSSIGCVFTTQVVTAEAEEALSWLKSKQINTYAAALTATTLYHEVDFTAPSAIVMGTEADGLSDFWLKHSFSEIKIPMRGKIDSLNVSTSCAVLVFEAMRQRNFNLKS